MSFWEALGAKGLDYADMGVQYGFNAMAASKSHDRQKNMITRMPAYLRSAGINPIMAARGGNWSGASVKPPRS